MLASVIGAYYYLRIVYLMYFGEEREGLDAHTAFLPYAGLMASAAIMLLGIVNLFGIEAPAAAAAEMLVR
jgi:NADH-quinone oxidoreductase subunit N